MALRNSMWHTALKKASLIASLLASTSLCAQELEAQRNYLPGFACAKLLPKEGSGPESATDASVNYTQLSLSSLRGRVYNEPLAMIEMARREALAHTPDQDVIYGYLHKAQEKGSSTAALELSKLYSGVSGFPRDDGFRVYWLKKAADLGSIVACQELGVHLHKKENHYDAVRYLSGIKELGASHSDDSLEALALSMHKLDPNDVLAEQYLAESANAGSNAALFALVAKSKRSKLQVVTTRDLIKIFSERLKRPDLFNSHTLTSLLDLLTARENLEKYAPIGFGICVNLLHPTAASCPNLMREYSDLLTLEEMSSIKGMSAQQTINLIHLRTKDEI